MNSNAQVIFDGSKPAFVVLSYKDYLSLTGKESKPQIKDAEFVPFVLSDYIKNPIRLKRIDAGLNQQQLAKLLRVTQGYVSRIESRSYTVTNELMEKVSTVISKKVGKRKK